MTGWRVCLGLLLAAAALAAAEGEPGKKEAAPPRALKLRLRDAVDLGLGRNLGLQSKRLDALMARIDVLVAEADWDPAFTGTVGGGERLDPSRSQLAGANIVDTDNAFFTLGLEKPTRFGPTLGLDWRSDRVFTNSTFSTINPAYESVLELSVTVPLLRGAGRKVVESPLRSARIVAEQGRLAFEISAMETIEEIGVAYWDLVYRRGQVDVLEQSWNVAKQVEESERRKLASGDGTRIDVAQAKAQAKRREADWIDGKRQAADAADRLRSMILPFVGNADDGIEIVPADVPGGLREPSSLDEAVGSALARRPEFRNADLEVERLNESILLAKDAVKPSLDLQGSVSGRSATDDFTSSVRKALDGSALSYDASLTLGYVLGQRAAKSSLNRSLLDRERAIVARLETMNSIVVEVRAAHRALLALADQHAASLEEVAAAEESFRGERLRLERGDSTVLLVNQAETALTEARLRELQNRVLLQGAEIALARVTGVLLDSFQVSFDADLMPVRTGEDGPAKGG